MRCQVSVLEELVIEAKSVHNSDFSKSLPIRDLWLFTTATLVGVGTGVGVGSGRELALLSNVVEE